MNKLETLYNVYKVQVEDIQSMFKNVNVYPNRYNITDTVNVGHNQIDVTIDDKVARWGNELVRIYFRKDWFENGKVKIEFNYGSGGWNEGDIKDQMSIMSEAWAGAKHIVEFMEANQEKLSEKLQVAAELHRKWSNAYDANQRIENATKEAIIEEEIREITSTFKRVTSIEQLIEVIKKSNNYGHGKLLKVTSAYNGINVSKFDFEYDKGQKTTFKYDFSRISKNDLKRLLTINNFYVIDEKNEDILGYRSAGKTFATKEEILEKIK